ncbi:MAG: c-type cytochrome biogenesis protein CcmI [Pseudomonadota bacterium]
MLWAIFVAMSAAAVAALLVPLVSRRGAAAARAAYDLEIYRHQLVELERDRARGALGEAEAKAARAEIARRMLAAADVPSGEASPAPDTPSIRASLAAVAVAVPIAAFALYLGLGSPGLPGQPFAERRQLEAQAGEREQVRRMVSRLAERLQAAPDDLEGWTLLARSLSALGRHAEALPAWRRAVALAPDSPELLGPFGESLVEAASGVVTPEARAAFERALVAEPGDPRARFYIGLARAQEGASREAIQMWTDLVAVSPEDAPWLALTRQQIHHTAAAARIDPATIRPSAAALAPKAAPAAPRGPGAAEIEAASRLPPAERAAMIRDMVERLARRLESEPGDLEGWRRLGRSWRALGEAEKSRAAYGRAAELAPERADVLADYAGTLIDGVSEGQKLPAEFVAVMRRVLSLDPDHADALWFVGLAEAEAGHRQVAIAHWRRLIERLPAGSPARAEIALRLQRLEAGN